MDAHQEILRNEVRMVEYCGTSQTTDLCEFVFFKSKVESNMKIAQMLTHNKMNKWVENQCKICLAVEDGTWTIVNEHEVFCYTSWFGVLVKAHILQVLGLYF